MFVKGQAASHDGVIADDERGREFYRARDAYSAAYKQYRDMRLEIRDDPVLVAIDEADRLTTASLEQVRAIFDQGGLGVVLIGMPGIEKRLSRVRAALFAGRLRPRIPSPGKEGSARACCSQGWMPPGVVLPGNWVADEEALAAILRITGGNFRLLERLLTQIARRLGGQ